ncbi:MAG: hypothetical protein A2X49_17040 [Lentisphaerae bacterium GWF2_52_8]|nr:MAG: hypothetical protein A2X49_17040 [Lentisphaerae bacterium GWF2_52_8]
MKLLAISFAFPPDSYPRSIQVSRLLSALPGECMIFCSSDDSAPKDDTILPSAPEGMHIERLPFSASFLRRCLWKLCRNVGGLPRSLSRLETGWSNSVTKIALAKLSQEKFAPDILVSFGEPPASHATALALKNELKIPWIAHLSDPWSDSPYLPRLAKKEELRRERMVVETADAVVVTSQETLELVSAKYPPALQKKFRVLHHAFAASRFPVIPPEHGILRHIGSFYGIRTPSPFFKGLAELAAARPALMNNLKIEFIGGIKEKLIDKTLLAKLPPGIISFNAHVPYKKSLNLIGAAWGLLIIDAMAKNSVFFPSKLVEYLGSGRPVIAITPKNSASARIVREAGGWVASPDSPLEIAAAIEDFLSKADNWDQSAARTAASQYEIAKVSERFGEICEEVLQ